MPSVPEAIHLFKEKGITNLVFAGTVCSICIDSSSIKPFDVYCLPTASFEFDSVCEGIETPIWSVSQSGNSPSANPPRSNRRDSRPSLWDC